MGKRSEKILQIGFIVVLSVFAFKLQGQDTLSHSDDKWLRSFRLMKHLYEPEKDTLLTYSLPQLIIDKADSGRTYFTYFNGSITISEKVYDICMSMRKDSMNALAFVFAHELTHHYQRKKGKFACSLHDNGLVFTNEDFLKEKEADVYGHYAARLAGFTPCQIGVKLMDKLYNTLPLDPNKPLPLNIRKQMITDACQAADTLVQLYECANYASIIGQYDIAGTINQYLLSRFPNNKMYYTTAINQLMYAKKALMDDDITKFDFPLLLDFNSQIRNSQTVVNNNEAYKILQNVDSLLSAAFKKDSTFLLAKYYILYAKHLQLLTQTPIPSKNLQITLLKELQTCSLPIDRDLLALHHMLEGILYSFSGEDLAAQKSWSSVTYPVDYATIAQENSKKLATNTFENSKEEKNCDTNFQEILPDLSRDTLRVKPILLLNLPSLQVYGLDSTTSYMYQIYQGGNVTKYRKISTSLPTYKIHIGIPEQVFFSLCTQPCFTQRLANGSTIYLYEDAKTLFQINPHNELIAWIHYKTSKP